MQNKQKVIYERLSSNNQTTCCFFSNSIAQQRPNQFNKKKQKFFVHNPETKNYPINIQSQNHQQTRSRRTTVSVLKKSLSSLNLKRKNSQNQKTNRTFYTHTDNQENLTKRFITTSMDSQVLKQYFPTDSQNRNRSAFLSPSSSYQGLNTKQQPLQSLFMRLQKQKYNQKKQKIMKKSITITPVSKVNKINIIKSTIYEQQKKNQNQIKRQNAKQLIKNIQVPGFLKQRKQTKQAQRKKFHYQAKTINMNQIQSILINVDETSQGKKYQNKPYLKKFSKQILQNKTVSSEYEPDEVEKKQRVEQSTILVNFFNPPSFITQKYDLDNQKSQIFKPYEKDKNTQKLKHIKL